jgi:hypothetical protein
MEATDRLRKFQQMFEVRKRKWENYSSGEELFGLPVTQVCGCVCVCVCLSIVCICLSIVRVFVLECIVCICLRALCVCL